MLPSVQFDCEGILINSIPVYSHATLNKLDPALLPRSDEIRLVQGGMAIDWDGIYKYAFTIELN